MLFTLCDSNRGKSSSRAVADLIHRRPRIHRPPNAVQDRLPSSKHATAFRQHRAKRIAQECFLSIALVPGIISAQTFTSKAVALAGEALFKAGDLEEADALWRAANPQTSDSLAWSALLALYSNHLEEAQELATRSRSMSADNARSTRVTAEVDRRNRDLAENYTHRFRGTVEIPFVKRDPLPVLAAKLPDGRVHYFLLDTGGGALRLDTEVAKTVATQMEGEETGTYAGGKTATVHRARLPRLEMIATGNPFVLEHIPVDVAPMGGMADAAGPSITIDGIIGTHLLMHFLSTIDYVGAKVVLGPRDSKANAERFSTPILLAGDHLIFARAAVSNGTQNKSGWLLVDTGLAGGGFMPGPGLREKITMPASAQGVGVGGGGQVQKEVFNVPELGLGNFIARDFVGVETLSGNALTAMPYHTTGLISHGAFQGHRLTLDFVSMTVRID